MRKLPKLLSKTKLMRGYRCQKCIYLTIHHPELEPPVTPELQALFDQGNLVGETARRYLPGGTLVDCKPWEFGDAIRKTRELIAAGVQTLYEPAFEYQGCYARADIIQYSPDSKRFSIYEVKSTTSVKPEHLQDVGLQTWIMAKSGLPIEKIHIMHLNRECRFPNLENLFVTTDVTAEMRERYPNVIGEVKQIFDTLTRSEVPDIPIGSYCVEPTECQFIEHCWKNIPDVSVYNLPGLKERKWELLSQSIISLDDDRLTDLNELQQRIVNTYKTGERYVDATAIKASLQDWHYPFIFLDFETINPAIPRYDETGPYHQVPFQFSAHILADKDAALTHQEYLHLDASDPRPELIKALLKACGDHGAIIAYYGKFEAARIQELANYSPEYREQLLALLPRIVDPLPIFREAVYDNAFAGSFSLKYVAPAILGQEHSYAEMDVANGGEAQRAFEEMIQPKTDPARKLALETALREYCTKDTMVMVDLVKWLYSN
jgi:Domain of unknown function(DUF2779)